MAGVGGAAHPDELRDRLDARQIAEWMAYAAIEPFGASHEELLHGIRAALLANANRKPESEPYEASDFMPSWVTPEMDWEEIRRNISEWKAITDGTGSET